MDDEDRPAWAIRLIEHVKNLEAIKGVAYRRKLLAWARLISLIGPDKLGEEGSQARKTVVAAGKEMGIDDADLLPMLRQMIRSYRDAERDE